MAVCLRLEAAPIAAFMATKASDGSDLHLTRSGRPERRGGWRSPAILLRDAKRPQDAAENRRAQALPVRHG
jgi:hypothetical protein